MHAWSPSGRGIVALDIRRPILVQLSEFAKLSRQNSDLQVEVGAQAVIGES